MSLPHGSRHALLHSAQFMLFLFRVACAAIPCPARSPAPGVNDVVARFVCSSRQMRAPAAVCKILTDHFVSFPTLSLFCAALPFARRENRLSISASFSRFPAARVPAPYARATARRSPHCGRSRCGADSLSDRFLSRSSIRTRSQENRPLSHLQRFSHGCSRNALTLSHCSK